MCLGLLQALDTLDLLMTRLHFVRNPTQTEKFSVLGNRDARGNDDTYTLRTVSPRLPEEGDSLLHTVRTHLITHTSVTFHLYRESD